MNALSIRKIVRIDEEKCDGCGVCVPGCAEGAIEIVDGKARLVADNLCDGLGNCLGTCPRGAITIEEQPVRPFDENAVEARRARQAPDETPPGHCPPRQCPGAAVRSFQHGEAPRGDATAERPSQLRHWPVQLALVPERGDIWEHADVLLAADCVAYSLGDFHDRLLAGRTLAVACPKLDDAAAYVDKLATVFAANDIRSITVARMTVPCCAGLEHIVREALARAGKTIPVETVIVDPSGVVLE